MGKKDIFGDDLEPKAANDFGAMLDQSMRPHRRLQVGETLTGEIVSIGKEESFVALGMAVDGMVPTAELRDQRRETPYKVGDQLEVVVLKVRDNEIRLRCKHSKATAEVDDLEDAHDMEIPVEGKVLEAVKGGYRVQLQGKMAFCPVSQIDARPGSDPSVYVGNKYEFLITKFEEAGRNIVVSRRKLLDLQKGENEGEFMQSHQMGDIVEGTVSRLELYGAFVEVAPGVEGLVHISEITWSRLAHPSEMLTVGMPVRVKILTMKEEDGRLRISLSIKQGGGETDPWLRVTQEFPVGRTVAATVAKKESFGLFVQLVPGIQGLLPRSKWRESADGASYENKKRGDPIQVRIEHIDLEARRLSLGLPGEEADDSWRQHSAASSSTGSGLGTLADLFKKK